MVWRNLIERGPAVAIWCVAMAAQLGGFTSVALALVLLGVAAFFLFVPAWHYVRAWHFRRTAKGARVGTPYIIMLAGLAMLWLAVTLLIAGAAWLLTQRTSSTSVNAATSTAATIASVTEATTDEGPLTWYNSFSIEGGPLVRRNVFSLRFKGVNSSQSAVRLKDAYLLSGINGTKLPLEVSLPGEIVSIDQIALIIPGAQIELVAKFGPPDPKATGKILGLDAKIWLETWRKFSLNVEDDTRTYRRDFTDSDFSAFFPGLVGPHVTKKQ